MIVLKRPEEISAMKRAGRVAAMAREKAKEAVLPGVNVLELARIAEDVILKAGGTPSFKGYNGFPGAICVSVNDEVVHGIPKDRRLREGDIVSLDIGAYVDGFHSDTATTVPVGSVSEAIQKLLEITETALKVAIQKAIPGNRVGDISAAVEETVQPHHYGIVRELAGHGIGRSIHEDPQILNYGRPGRGPTLREGMTLAIEPMINLGEDEVQFDADGWTVRTRDRKPSAHFEHTVLVASEPVILTAV